MQSPIKNQAKQHLKLIHHYFRVPIEEPKHKGYINNLLNSYPLKF